MLWKKQDRTSLSYLPSFLQSLRDNETWWNNIWAHSGKLNNFPRLFLTFFKKNKNFQSRSLMKYILISEAQRNKWYHPEIMVFGYLCVVAAFREYFTTYVCVIKSFSHQGKLFYRSVSLMSSWQILIFFILF